MLDLPNKTNLNTLVGGNANTNITTATTTKPAAAAAAAAAGAAGAPKLPSVGGKRERDGASTGVPMEEINEGADAAAEGAPRVPKVPRYGGEKDDSGLIDSMMQRLEAKFAAQMQERMAHMLEERRQQEEKAKDDRQWTAQMLDVQGMLSQAQKSNPNANSDQAKALQLYAEALPAAQSTNDPAARMAFRKLYQAGQSAGLFEGPVGQGKTGQRPAAAAAAAAAFETDEQASRRLAYQYRPPMGGMGGGNAGPAPASASASAATSLKPFHMGGDKLDPSMSMITMRNYQYPGTNLNVAWPDFTQVFRASAGDSSKFNFQAATLEQNAQLLAGALLSLPDSVKQLVVQQTDAKDENSWKVANTHLIPGIARQIGIDPKVFTDELTRPNQPLFEQQILRPQQYQQQPYYQYGAPQAAY